jgi:hypothetical protein
VTAQNETPIEPATDMVDDPIVLGLKRLYDSVLDEAVPDDFMNLLGQIDATLAQHEVEHKAEDGEKLEKPAHRQRP